MVLKVGSYWNFHGDCYQYVVELNNNEAYVVTTDPELNDDELLKRGRWHREWIKTGSIIDFLTCNHIPLLYKPKNTKLGKILYGS